MQRLWECSTRPLGLGQQPQPFRNHIDHGTESIRNTDPASKRTPDPAAPKVEHPLINHCFIGSVRSLLLMSLIRISILQVTSKKRKELKEMPSNSTDLLAVSGPAERGNKFMFESNTIEGDLEEDDACEEVVHVYYRTWGRHRNACLNLSAVPGDIQVYLVCGEQKINAYYKRVWSGTSRSDCVHKEGDVTWVILKSHWNDVQPLSFDAMSTG
ncbi:uncharacterized protein LOC116215022 [Punica granatum]|uniref:Uncharacterized protein LOC116215022 n=1 Tax=Punica granatum TaxID=22663 RepID=A0A6P8EJ49_PUNGR|nr:uncharacterized protein LOC116215022 [Punica granatum]